MANIQHALDFLLHVLFDLFITCLMLRLLLQWVRADFYNPLSQFLVKITNPLLLPMRRVIPGLGGIDIAALVLALSLETSLVMLSGLLLGFRLSLSGAFLMGTAQLLNLLVYIYIVAILIQVLISWINPYANHALMPLLRRLTGPVLEPVRRRLPAIAGLDLSPLIVLVGLQLVLMLVSTPIFQVGKRIAIMG